MLIRDDDLMLDCCRRLAVRPPLSISGHPRGPPFFVHPRLEHTGGNNSGIPVLLRPVGKKPRSRGIKVTSVKSAFPAAIYFKVSLKGSGPGGITSARDQRVKREQEVIKAGGRRRQALYP